MPVYRLTRELVFPDPHEAEPGGLLAVGGDLGSARLLLAYSMGIFPWYSVGQPILWWSPDPRCVLDLDDFHVSRRLRRVLNQGRFDVTFDADFRGVIRACASVDRHGQDGTWITPEMEQAYVRLHDAGLAHSVECRRGGELVGGIYGIALGRGFFGESMFHRATDASKVALARLVERLAGWGFHFIDAQVTTSHMLSLGAREVPREAFLASLDEALRHPTRRGSWCEPGGTR
ncbi:MAG: leucyl/phenylalanyl-tRNA--protein transferase [Deltaproteobacteria bacterium]|nr:leucyl/phenylalanyl-tRNA--protein transferase [Deltaproteobacteria bacterium]